MDKIHTTMSLAIAEAIIQKREYSLLAYSDGTKVERNA